MGIVAGLIAKWRAAFTTQPPEKPLPEVIVHDPAANKPHDLDDPFFDAKVQARMAETIAKAARKK